MNSKHDIRDHMLARREAMDAASIQELSARMARKLTEYQGAQMAAYLPIRGEVDAWAIAQKLGGITCLPSIEGEGKILTFRRYQAGDALVQGKHHIMCPPSSAAEMQPDILLVPLLAFDKARFRLGYGGGYYDATIAALKAKNPGLVTIGLAYDFQKVDVLPREAHDIALSMIVTEAERI